MHILLVNDDGIGAVGIMALLKSAAARGHKVTMCAPSGQMSAASHRITLTDPLFAKEYPLPYPGCTGYAISGTPADCVRLALAEGGLITDKVDLIISGINNGYNAGTAVYYSGTVAAAREGAFYRIHSIAASIKMRAKEENLMAFADFIVETGEKYVLTPFQRGVILNVNAPDLDRESWSGITYAPLAKSHFLDRYDRRFSPRAGTYFWLDDFEELEPADEGSDLWYLERSHTVLTLISAPECVSEEEYRTLGLP